MSLLHLFSPCVYVELFVSINIQLTTKKVVCHHKLRRKVVWVFVFYVCVCVCYRYGITQISILNAINLTETTCCCRTIAVTHF